METLTLAALATWLIAGLGACALVSNSTARLVAAVRAISIDEHVEIWLTGSAVLFVLSFVARWIGA